MLRPDVSTHVARNFSVTVTPLIERHVKESITKTLIPAYAEATTAMQMNLSREISSEILNLKKEIVTWQGEALRGTEVRWLFLLEVGLALIFVSASRSCEIWSRLSET